MPTFEEYVMVPVYLRPCRRYALGLTKQYREYDLLGKGEAEKASLSPNIVSVLQAGAFLGALVAMWLANRVGRRWSLIIASILIFIGVAMQAGASGTMAVMYIGR